MLPAHGFFSRPLGSRILVSIRYHFVTPPRGPIYLAHFNLQEPPFALTPDPRYLYLSDRYREGLAHLIYGLEEGSGCVQPQEERVIVVRKPQGQEDQILARPKVDEWETALCDLTFE